MTTPVTQRKGSIWRTIKAVSWSFVGLRTRGDYEKDVQQLKLMKVLDR